MCRCVVGSIGVFEVGGVFIFIFFESEGLISRKCTTKKVPDRKFKKSSSEIDEKCVGSEIKMSNFDL